ncbi:hypothetical protein K2P56_00390 [Patescibacteria group bacterium]|nr:hypothetical protein [Patescibacteria group bacterium]
MSKSFTPESIRPPEDIRWHLAKRTDISPIVRRVKRGEKILETRSVHPEDRSEARRIWDAVKPQRSAFHALFIEEAFAMMKLENNAGEVPEDPRQALRALKSFTGGILYSSFTRLVHQLRNPERPLAEHNPELQTAFNAYSPLMEMYQVYLADERAQVRTAELLLLGSGVKTGIEMTWATVEALPILAKQQGITLTVTEARACLEPALRATALTGTGFNLEHMGEILKHMFIQDRTTGEHSVDPTFFILQKTGTGYTLGFNWQKIRSLEHPLGGPLFSTDAQTVTTGCPIRHARGSDGREVLHSYFEWVLDLAEKSFLPKVCA